METLVGSGMIDPMEDLSHMEDFLVEEFSSEQGSTILKANSVIDPSSWTLVSLNPCLHDNEVINDTKEIFLS